MGTGTLVAIAMAGGIIGGAAVIVIGWRVFMGSWKVWE